MKSILIILTLISAYNAFSSETKTNAFRLLLKTSETIDLKAYDCNINFSTNEGGEFGPALSFNVQKGKIGEKNISISFLDWYPEGNDFSVKVVSKSKSKLVFSQYHKHSGPSFPGLDKPTQVKVEFHLSRVNVINKIVFKDILFPIGWIKLGTTKLVCDLRK